MSRLLAHRWAPFLITDSLVQNDPDQPAEPMRNRPDGLVVSQAWHQAAIHNLEDTAFVFDRGVACLIENPPHMAVALGAAVAAGDARALFVSGADSDPGREVLLRSEGGGGGPDLGQDL